MQRACDTKRYAAAASLWGAALTADPRLGDDRQALHRYNAACAAALAAAGEGKDGPRPDAARATLRGKALAWLRAELGVWKTLLQGATPDKRAAIIQRLRYWQEDSDRVSVREPAVLAPLPGVERSQWEALGADVAAVLAGRLPAAPASELPADPFGRP